MTKPQFTDFHPTIPPLQVQGEKHMTVAQWCAWNVPYGGQGILYNVKALSLAADFC